MAVSGKPLFEMRGTYHVQNVVYQMDLTKDMAMSTSKESWSLKCSFENAPLGFPYIQSLLSLKFLAFSEQSSSLGLEQFPSLAKLKMSTSAGCSVCRKSSISSVPRTSDTRYLRQSPQLRPLCRLPKCLVEWRQIPRSDLC
jgi:hypothetical protein